MATSTITIYKNTYLNYEKNFIIDDLKNYLNDKVIFVRNNFQYFKTFELQCTIKLNLSQELINPLDIANMDYLKVENSDMSNSTFYYFIINKEWKGEETIQLKLQLDCLNTFTGMFTFSEKTTIIRQHKDRFKFLRKIGVENYYSKLIDLESEGLDVAKYKIKEEILANEYTFLKWYLYYKSDENNIISCNLIPSESINIEYISSFNFGNNNLQNGKAFLFLKTENPKMYIRNGDDIITYDDDTEAILIYCRFNTTYEFTGFISKIRYINNEYLSDDKYSFKEYRKIYLEGDYKNYYSNTNTYSVTSINDVITKNFSDIKTEFNILNELTQTTKTGQLKGLGLFSRNDPKIVKIIECPYCPTFIEKGETAYKLSDISFSYNETAQTLTLNDLQANFQNTLYFDDVSLFDEKTTRMIATIDLKTIKRNAKYEPKLLHSDFYQKQFIYDSFDYLFKFELLNDEKFFTSGTYITFKATNTINSNFMFRFDDYLLKFGESNYDGILNVSRNNEITTYNNDYINYINNGYNYDRKNQVISNLANWGYVGLSLATRPHSLITLTSAFSALENSIQNEISIQKKLADLKMKSANVYGANDIDLLNFYANGNKAKIVTYNVSEKMQNLLFNLFFYNGYISNTLGIPNTTSRSRFNYVQAKLVFETTTNMYEIHKDELIDKFNQGVTYIHHFNNMWDLKQEYENWEVSML